VVDWSSRAKREMAVASAFGTLWRRAWLLIFI
jgi:hypothetical protein